jgi:hypothetical protein
MPWMRSGAVSLSNVFATVNLAFAPLSNVTPADASCTRVSIWRVVPLL